MDKLILIDGNSLLNRAFYAIAPFSTKAGQPTNGIFGFVRLLFKILEDESPRYMAVAFDLRAPTFRHKMYDGYKATRKPMPEELAVQVPVLKDVLRAVMSKKARKRSLCRAIKSMVPNIMSMSVMSVATRMIEMKMRF